MTLIRALLLSVAAGVCLCLTPGCTQPVRYDVIIRGGEVVAGDGAAALRADVGITGDRITAVGNLVVAEAGTVIDATGLVVSPGFIDVQGQSGTTLLADGNGESHLPTGPASASISSASASGAPPSTSARSCRPPPCGAL